jgi:hypothetical protein
MMSVTARSLTFQIASLWKTDDDKFVVYPHGLFHSSSSFGRDGALGGTPYQQAGFVRAAARSYCR